MADQQTVEDLGKKVKVKYPGSYDDIPDAELGARVKTKHPEYSDFADLPGSGSMPNLRGTPVGGIEGAAPIAGRFAAEQLPAAGAAIGGSIGTVASPSLVVNPVTGAMAGATAGSALKGILKSKFPKYFGEDENANDPTGAALDIGKDAAIQGATEGALQGASRVGELAQGSTIGKAITAKILASKGGQMFPSVERATEGAAATGLKDLGGREGLDIRQVLKAGSTGSGKYNPEKIMTELQKPDYDFTISSEAKKQVSDFASNLHALKAGEGSTNYLINYAKGHLMLMAPSLLAGASGHLEGAAGAAAGMVLTDHALGKLMNNPETAQLVVKAMRTPATAPEADLLQKALTAATRGSVAGAQTPDK